MMIRTAAIVLVSVAAPALASDATLLQADRSVNVDFSEEFAGDPSPPPFSDSIASTLPGLFDAQTADSPFNAARGFAAQTSTVDDNAGILSVNAASSIESILGPSGQSSQESADLSSLLSVDFSIASQSMWSLDTLLSSNIQDNSFGGPSGFGSELIIELTGPSGVVFTEVYNAFSPIDASGTDFNGGFAAASFNFSSSGLIEPGTYTFDIRHTGSDQIGFGTGSGFQDIYEFDADITFVVPAPSALALLTVAPLAIRRRR